MTPALAALIVQALGLVIQDEPQIALGIQQLFASGAPTPEQFAALSAAIAAEDYSQFVPKTDLPSGTPGL